MFSLLARLSALLLLPLSASLSFAFASPALAHHGWSAFDTRHAYFVSGTVTYVRWGNPHSEVQIKVEDTKLPADWTNRALPPGADESSGRATMGSARSYGGEQKELRLVLAGPGWMERWGLDRPLKVGEKLEVVGFLNSSEDRELRPMMFWLSDGKGVWQQLTSLPHRPEPAPSAPSR